MAARNRFFRLELLGILALTFGSSPAQEARAESGRIIAQADAPEPVRAAIGAEAPGAAVNELEKCVLDGRTVYRAEANIGGRAWRLSILEDGTLISKSLEN